jgi:glycosyltransferase 2 family protein
VSSKVKALIGLLISGILVYFLVTSKAIDWHKAWEYVRTSNKWLLAASSAAATAIFALRAIRWRVILPDPKPGEPRLRFSSLFKSCIIGQMATNVIPGRAGELARPYALNRMEPSIPFSTGFASVIVDRVFDGIVVLLLLVVAVLDPRFPRDATVRGMSVATFALLGTAGVVVGLSGLFWLVLHPASLIGFARRIVRPISQKWEEPVAKFLARFALGLTVLRDMRRSGIALLWTLAHWVLCAASYWLAYKAIGLDAPLTSTLFMQTILVLAVALPQAPGFVGVFEGVAIASLAVYGVPADLAAAWAVVYHVISYIPVTGLGLIYFARLGLTFREIGSRGEAGA